jgi:hypothetical protein
MRVVEVGPKRVTFATLAGHPLAGIVQFESKQLDEGVRFTVEIFARAASTFDLLAMRTVGGLMQSLNWHTVVERMVKVSGGDAPEGVQSESKTLEGEERSRAERLIEELVARHARAEADKEIGARG